VVISPRRAEPSRAVTRNPKLLAIAV
jgi:hypothetical protein